MKNPFKDPIYAASKPKRSKKAIIAIAIPIILLLGLILTLIISSAVKNAPSPVMKIDMGDSTSQVERILGKPDEKNDFVWQYYGGEYKKLYNKQEKLLQKLETADEDEYEKIFEEVSEISDKLDTLEYSFTAITFDGDMKVNTIIHNSKVSKTATQGKSIESYELFPKYVSALSDPNFVKFTAKEKYYDKSYYYGPVNPDRSKIDTFKSGSCSVSWRSYFGNTKGTDCSRSISINETIEAGTTISGIVGRNVFTAKIENECTLDNLKLDITITNDYYALSYDSENDKNWAKLRPYISSVTISNGISSIGSEVFKDCTSMTKVTIPESVTTIDEKAFEGCKALTSITIPENMKSINNSAFKDCSSITTVNWNAKFFTPDKNTERSIFADCKDLTNVNLGEKVTNIPAYLLSGCSKLTSITIPDSVTSIGEGAFYGCSALEEIKVSEANTAYASQDGILYNNTKTEFVHIPIAIKGAVTVPDSVTTIDSEAFAYCSSLTSITIPNSVTSIGDSAFSSCSALTSITIPDSVTEIGYMAFMSCTSLTTVNWNATACTFAGAYFESIFKNCDKLATVNVGNNVNTIPDSAFSGCSALENIKVENGNTKYHSDGNCLIETASKTLVTGCNNSVIPADGSVTSIGYKAFYGCSALTSITIPDSVASIGEGAFYGCSALEEIKVSEANTAYASQDGILYNNAKTEFVHIPIAIKGAVTIPNGVTSIGNYAFRNRSALTSIDIPDSVKSIGERAFDDCSALTSISIPDSVKSIGEWAFWNCSSLTSITIGNGVTSIGSDAFWNCSSLTSITIGNSVTTIGDYAFDGCSSLTNIMFKGTKSQWIAIIKLNDWNYNSGNFTIQCTDGKLDKNGNEIN